MTMVVPLNRPLTADNERGALRIWAHNCKLAVEVGTWTGYTAIAIAGAMPEDGKLFCIDNFCGAVDPSIRKNFYGNYTEQSISDLWHQHIEQAGYRDKVTLLTRLSNETQGFNEGTLDLCFIDATHEYPYPLQDIKAWWPMIRPGGIMCGHDYDQSWRGVIDSVEEFFGKEPNKLPVQLGPGSLWKVEKPREYR